MPPSGWFYRNVSLSALVKIRFGRLVVAQLCSAFEIETAYLVWLNHFQKALNCHAIMPF